jgi:hypothetical protein
MSIEDLRVLRDIVQKQATGIGVEDNPENNAVVQRPTPSLLKPRRNTTRRSGKPGPPDEKRARASQRRLEKLESLLNVLSTDDRWAMIHERTLQLVGDAELEALEDDAFWSAMGEMNFRFTIPEMDQLLDGA